MKIGYAVILAVALAIGGTSALVADVKTQERTRVQFEGALGKVVNFFGGRAAREGIVVTDAELADQIMRIGAFQEGGRFSRERYVRLLAMAQPPMTPGDFEADFRTELARQRLQVLIAGGAKVSEAETRQAWEAERSRVRAGYLLVSAGAGDALQATDAELDAYYKAHPAEFTQPERRRVAHRRRDVSEVERRVGELRPDGDRRHRRDDDALAAVLG